MRVLHRVCAEFFFALMLIGLPAPLVGTIFMGLSPLFLTGWYVWPLAIFAWLGFIGLGSYHISKLFGFINPPWRNWKTRQT